MPRSIRHHTPDRALLYAERFRELHVSLARPLAALTNLLGDRLGEFGVAPTLNVDAMRDGFEMRGVDTRGQPAQMVDVEPVWYFPMQPHVCLTVRQSTTANTTAVGEYAVTVTVVGAEEYETGSVVSTVFLTPEMDSPFEMLSDTRPMTFEEAERFTFDPTEVRVVTRDNQGEMPAAALAEMIGFNTLSHRVILQRQGT